MRLIIAHLRACARTQLDVLCDQLRVLSVRKCADFHETRLIYAYLSTRMFARFGIPEYLRSDNGHQYVT